MNTIQLTLTRIARRVSPLQRVPAILAMAMLPSATFAATIYDEGTDGDLDGAGASATPLPLLTLGSNQVFGETGRNSAAVRDLDYFTFTVPAGFQLTQILLLKSAPNAKGFAGFEVGSQFTVPPTVTDAAGLLGWVHYSALQVGTDLLDDIGGSGFGATGFTPPLGAGTYSVWVQDTNPGPLPYGFDFILRPVPDQGNGVFVAAMASLGTFSFYSRNRSRLS